MISKRNLFDKIKLSLVFVVLLVSGALNLGKSQDLYSARPPIFSGVDMASSWEWRSMAVREHSWWLTYYFPNSQVTNVAYAPPPGDSSLLPVGIQFSGWRDDYLSIDFDTTEPPLDIAALGVREELLNSAKVFSRIHCRDNQQMLVRDTCFFFVAWDESQIDHDNPVFVAVRTNLDVDSEYALVERNLLSSVLPQSISSTDNIWESE